MKNLLMVSNGEHLAVRFLKAASVLLIGFALAASLWIASTPAVVAQDMTPPKMIESQLPQGQTVETAKKADFLAAVCAAVKRYRPSAPQIVRFAVEAHPEWKKDILRTAFSCLGTDDCRLLTRVLRSAIAGSPNDANDLAELAIKLAPGCSGAFGDNKGGGGTDPGTDPGTDRESGDEGNFGNAPGNINPPPGSVGGGGGQGNVVAVCFNGQTRFFTPEGAEDFLRNNPGATLGACQVTPAQNQ